MRLGAHQSIAGGVFNAIYHGRTATCETVQIFNKSNNQWRAKELKDDEVEKYFAAIKETGIDVACSHTSYLINIASPDPELSEKSYQSLKTEMERCNLLKIPDLVLHPGSHVGSGEEAGLDKVVENVNRLLDDLGSDNSVRLCLEATAGQGTNLGHKFEHLAYIIDKADDKEHLSVCLDSCHIFAAGYDLIDPKGYKKTIKAFDDTVGLGYLRIFHLNDSKKEQGSKRDRHEHIGEGFIGIEGFRNIVNDKKLKNVAGILETPKDDELKEDIKNLKLLRSLINKK